MKGLMCGETQCLAPASPGLSRTQRPVVSSYDSKAQHELCRAPRCYYETCTEP